MLSRHALDGTFLSASSAVENVLGRPASAVIGATLQQLVVAEDIPLVQRVLTDAAASDEPVIARVRLARPEGVRSVEICGHGVHDPRSGAVSEIHCITRDLADELALTARATAAEGFSQRLQTLLANVPGVVWAAWRSDTGEHAAYVSDYITSMIGYPPEAWNASPNFWMEIGHPDDQPYMMAHGSDVFVKGQDILQFRWVHRDGHPVWIEAHLQVLRNQTGDIIGLCGVNMDVTQKKAAEEAEVRLREEIISTQERILAELSTPLIPINARVIAVPLVGTLDGPRATRVVETLLQGIVSSRARFAIVDITGVSTMDTQTADTLVRAAKGVRLLGARVILTGIRPEVAQTLISLGTDFGDLITLNTLEAGIQYAMQNKL
jgi:rsbT co-antagonist protein RsbR